MEPHPRDEKEPAVTTTTVARTRNAGVHDIGQVTAMHLRCSAETLHRRFHVPLPHVPARLVRRLVAPPGGWSVLAEQCGEAIGLACAGPVSDTQVEVGLLVEDAHQGTGVGTRLLRQVAADATERGYRTLVLLTQPDNDSVLRTVRRAGLDGVAAWNDGLLEVTAPLAADPRELDRPA
jgi:GNAT superfamily N-acetyltransferase